MIWGIFLAVLAALALLGRTRLGFRGTYTRQEVGVWFRLGAFQWRLYPWKKEKKPEKPKEVKKELEPPKPEEPKPPILSQSGVFRLVRRLLPVALEGADAFRRRLQVDVLQLEIVAGGPDPATAAERYGQINALLGAVWQPAVQVLHIRDGRVHVDLDFDRRYSATFLLPDGKVFPVKYVPSHRADNSAGTQPRSTGGSPPCMGRPPCPSPPASFCGWACGTAPGV